MKLTALPMVAISEDTEFIAFNTEFITFNTKFSTFTTNSLLWIHTSSILIQIATYLKTQALHRPHSAPPVTTWFSTEESSLSVEESLKILYFPLKNHPGILIPYWRIFSFYIKTHQPHSPANGEVRPVLQAASKSKIIILNTKNIIFNAHFLIFSTNFIIFNTYFIEISMKIATSESIPSRVQPDLVASHHFDSSSFKSSRWVQKMNRI